MFSWLQLLEWLCVLCKQHVQQQAEPQSCGVPVLAAAHAAQKVRTEQVVIVCNQEQLYILTKQKSMAKQDQ